jgi:hypothetical protein
MQEFNTSTPVTSSISSGKLPVGSVVRVKLTGGGRSVHVARPEFVLGAMRARFDCGKGGYGARIVDEPVSCGDCACESHGIDVTARLLAGSL